MSRWQDRDARRARQLTEMTERLEAQRAFEAQPWDMQIDQAEDLHQLKEILVRFVRHHDLES
jgi:hypothetical protein